MRRTFCSAGFRRPGGRIGDFRSRAIWSGVAVPWGHTSSTCFGNAHVSPMGPNFSAALDWRGDGAGVQVTDPSCAHLGGRRMVRREDITGRSWLGRVCIILAEICRYSASSSSASES